MTIRIENVNPHIGGIVHVDKAHLCDDDLVKACRRFVPYDEVCGRTMHRTTIMGAERLGRPLAVQLQ